MGARPPPSPLARRLPDQRQGQVVFLSHCVLDENTRYLGGAGRPGCVREIVDVCATAGLGVAQLPCPEEAAWCGVLTRRLLRLYGGARPARRTRRAPSPVADRLRAATTNDGIGHDVTIRLGVGHGFMNDNDPADITPLLKLLGRISGIRYDEPARRPARP
jgi:hypothetical protein